MNRLRPTIDLSYGDQEVLQRVLAEPRRIADALAPDDAREHRASSACWKKWPLHSPSASSR